MSKGKSKSGGRSGSDSNNASRASASDRRSDNQQLRQDKNLKTGTEQGGKLKDWQGGGKRDVRK
jgi:hypothetical protein